MTTNNSSQWVSHRKLTESDLEQVWSIVNSCRTLQKLNFELNWSEASVSEALKVCQGVGLVLNEQNRSHSNENPILAFVLFRGLREIAEIDLLAVQPSFQRKGLMKLLIEQLLNRFAQIWLEVHEQNHSAIAFYQAMGFQQTGVREAYYKDGKSAILFSKNRDSRTVT